MADTERNSEDEKETLSIEEAVRFIEEKQKVLQEGLATFDVRLKEVSEMQEQRRKEADNLTNLFSRVQKEAKEVDVSKKIKRAFNKALGKTQVGVSVFQDLAEAFD